MRSSALLISALLTAVAVGFAAGGTVQGLRWAAADAARVELEAETTRLQMRSKATNAQRNDRETAQALSRARAAALDARSDLERLRNAAGAAAASTEPAAPGCDDDGRLARLAELLTEGADLAEEGGRRVRQLAEEKASLQRYAAEEQ